jgi:hypothetical protein
VPGNDDSNFSLLKRWGRSDAEFWPGGAVSATLSIPFKAVEFRSISPPLIPNAIVVSLKLAAGFRSSLQNFS